MKLTIVLLFLTMMQVSAATFAQKLSLKKNNVTLKQVFKEIKKQTGYDVLYQPEKLKDNQKVNADFTETPLAEVVKKCLNGLGMDFVFYENAIVIKQERPVSDKEIELFVKPVTVTGRVTDTTNLPLPGVTVKVKGSTAVAVTDAQGRYNITVLNNDAVLVFSYIGYITQEIKLGDRTSLDVVLHEGKKGLSEIVIVGYGSQSKALVTGAIATVKMNEVLGDRPVTTLASLLQGVSPGLQVGISSGQPGASSSFNIRGATDFGSASNSQINSSGPFILVDNVPYNGALNLLDPNDIESVTVLKDAGSAAIYGARSAFGVILITTKSGKKNQAAQLEYSDNFNISTPMNLPQKVSPSQQVQSWIDGGRTAGYYTGQDLPTWLTLIQQYNANPGSFPGGYSITNGVFYQLQATDALKQLLGNTAFQQTHNVSVTGGSEKTTYRISGGITNEDGIIVPSAHQDNFKRYNFKSLITTDVNPWLNTQLDVGYNSSVTTTPSYTNAFADATWFPSVYTLTTIPGIPGVIGSPSNVISNTAPVVTNSDEVRITARTILKPAKGLTVTGEYTVDNTGGLVTNYNEQPQVTILGPATHVATAYGNGTFSKTNSTNKYNALNVYANYQKSIGKHNFTLTAGYNQEQSSIESELLSRTQPISPTVPSISTSTGPTTGSDSYTQYATQGVFGRLNYDFNGKYLLQINGRYDGSSKFPDGHREGFFPSASAGWRIIQEKFMDVVKPVLTDLKLRASLGQVGNQNIASYAYYAQMLPYNPYFLNNGVPVTTLTSPGLISPLFTWETVQTLDFGADLGFFNNRLTGTFDWYRRDTRNILTTNPTPLPAVLGTAAPLQNSGALRTTGFELAINWRDNIGKVSYNVGASLFDYSSVVTNVNNPINGLSNLYIGQKIGEIWGYTSDRLFTVNDFVPGSLNTSLKGGTLLPGIAVPSGEVVNPGDMKFKDLNGDGVISNGANTLANPGDLRIIGNSSQRYQYGLNGGVAYKGISFSFVVNGVLKQDVYINNPLMFPNSYSSYSALYTNELNYWTPTNLNAYYARIYTDAATGGNQGTNDQVQTRYLQNGAYLRVRNLTLGYNLPQKLMSKIHVSKARLFYSIENVVTFDHLPKGIEPDVVSASGGAGNGQGYPFMRKSSVGLNITF